jgi:hypothetical protein
METVGSFEPVVAVLRPLTLASVIADIDRLGDRKVAGLAPDRFQGLCWRALVAIMGETEAEKLIATVL